MIPAVLEKRMVLPWVVIFCWGLNRSLLDMRQECLAALQTQHMPTTRNEEYRFIDLTPILQQSPQVSPLSLGGVVPAAAVPSPNS